MNEAQRDAVDIVKSAGEKYKTVTDAELDSLTDRLAPGDEIEDGTVPFVLAIGVPSTVNIDTTNPIPVFFAKRWTGQREWEVDLQQNMTWVITDLRSGLTKAAVPLTLDKRRMKSPKPSRTPPPPSEVNRSAVTYGIEKQHLPALFGRTWPGDKFAVTLVVYDMVSNTVLFERTPKLPPPEEALRTPTSFVEATAGRGPAAQEGLQIKAVGETRLEIAVAAPRTSLVVVKSTEDPAARLLALSLILRKLDSTDPIVLDLSIPASEAGETVNASVAIHAREFPALKGLTGEFQVYLAAGSWIAGPAVLNLQ